jgi:hypothetical protein
MSLALSTRGPRQFSFLIRVSFTALALSVVVGCRETVPPAGDGPGRTIPDSVTTSSTEATSPPATLDERESPYDLSVEISPSSASVGTVITITASECENGQDVEFGDREAVNAGASAPSKAVPFTMSGSTLTAQYTISPDDSVGGAVVTVICSNGQGSAPVRIVPR